MGFGGANMNKMLKQMQKMQTDMVKMQDDLADMTVEASAGGGVVKIVMTGKQEVKELFLDPEILQPEEREMVQDLLMAAFNEAVQKSQNMATEQMSKITGGIKVPGLF